MYKRDFDKLLSAKNINFRAVFLYGEESFLLSHYAEKIAQLKDRCEAQKNLYYFGEYDFSNALSCFSQGSLFGDENLVWIKIDKKITKKELDSIIAAINKQESGYLILEFHKNDAKTSSEYAQDCRTMSGSFKAKNCVEVRFFALNLNESLGILREYAKALQIQIADFLLRKILEQQNFDLGLAVAELRKYSIFDGEINGNMIDDVGYGLGGVAIDEILETLLLKKPYMSLLNQFLEHGAIETDVIAEVQKYFFTLFLFASHIRIHGDATSEEVLGYKLPPNILEKRKNFSMQIRIEQYGKIFYVLNKWREESLKGMHKGNGFLLALIKIQAILR